MTDIFITAINNTVTLPHPQNKEQPDHPFKGKDHKPLPKALNDNPTLNIASDIVLRHLEDRKIGHVDDFIMTDKKASGLTAGYVASRIIDDQRFMLKHAFKVADSMLTPQQKTDRHDLVNEYTMAPLYRRMLYDRTPIIELTTTGEEIKNDIFEIEHLERERQYDSIFIRSKFLRDFETMAIFAGDKNYQRHQEVQRLRKLQGFEKVIASCLMFGEGDYHAGNLGVSRHLINEQIEHIVNKIDHGRSATTFFSSAKEMHRALQERLNLFGYENIPMNIISLKNAIDEGLKISEDEIKNLIQARLANLDHIGFDFKNLNLNIYIDNKTIHYKTQTWEERANLYIKLLLAHRKIMEQYSNVLAAAIAQQNAIVSTWENKRWMNIDSLFAKQ